MTKPLITTKQSKRYPQLYVKKYTKQVFYKGMWGNDPDLLEARGHVVDETGNVVIRPFTKVFNYGENSTTIHRDVPCLWIEKINGFMAAATYVDVVDRVVVSTTGSLDSDFVDMAIATIPPEMMNFIKDHGRGTTFLFEIVHKDDPHVVPEEEGAYLIGAREVSSSTAFYTCTQTEETLDRIAAKNNVKRPKWGTAGRFGDILQSVKRCEREGVMVYSMNEPFTALKIKSPFYLALKATARRKDIMSLNKERVDEEFYNLVDHLKENSDAFNEMDEQSRLTYVREWLIKNPWSNEHVT